MTLLPRHACAAALVLGAGWGAAEAVPWTIELRNSAGQPLMNAAVAVELRGQPSKAGPGVKAEMSQRERQFQPAMLVVQTGTPVNFPNFDTVRHHVYSFSAAKKFDLKLYSGTPAEPVLFDKPGVAALGCNIHDRMSAHIVVVDTPVFGKSDAQGLVKLDLPAGEHRLLYWHPSLSLPQLQTQALQVGSSAGHTALSLPAAP